MAQDVRIVWEEIQAKLAKEFGKNKNKLALVEILCLRQCAVNILRATITTPAKKSKQRKRFTR